MALPLQGLATQATQAHAATPAAMACGLIRLPIRVPCCQHHAELKSSRGAICQLHLQAPPLQGLVTQATQARAATPAAVARGLIRLTIRAR